MKNKLVILTILLSILLIFVSFTGCFNVRNEPALGSCGHYPCICSQPPYTQSPTICEECSSQWCICEYLIICENCGEENWRCICPQICDRCGYEIWGDGCACPRLPAFLFSALRVNAPYAFIIPSAQIGIRGKWGMGRQCVFTSFAPATDRDAAILEAVGLELHNCGLLVSYNLNQIDTNTLGVTMRSLTIFGRPFADLQFDIAFYVDGFDRGVRTVQLEIFSPHAQTGSFSFNTTSLNNAIRTHSFATNIQAFAPNRTVRFSLAEDSEPLPRWLELLPSGLLFTPRTASNPLGIVPNLIPIIEHNFHVKAEVYGQPPQFADFTITVDYAFLNFPPQRIGYTMTRGEFVRIPITGASTPDNGEAVGGIENVLISHSFHNVTGNVLPRGLRLEDGYIVGTPERAYGRYSFRVLASAEGYNSRSSEITIYIQERIVNTKGIFEAEFVDMRRRSGSGGGGASYVGMIQQVAYGARNWFYVGWHYRNSIDPNATTNPPFSFVFNSTAAIEYAPLIVRLSSETMDMLMTPENYHLYLNGKVLDFEPFTVVGIRSGQFNIATFQDFHLGYHPIRQGKNILRVAVLANNFGFYGQGAPGFDHIRFENFGNATLTWRPHTYNLRGADRDFWEQHAPYIY
ncbi:MAG: hypothetical protein FWE13_03890 [Firmicutes bacterium]|nr:hypothetical protein [Bacillota bacterium]